MQKIVITTSYLEKYHNIKSTSYEFDFLIKYLEKTGKQLFGNHFLIHESDHEIIYKLLVWFLGDIEKIEKHDMDFKKGILLSGPVGCGKTTLMTLMRHCTNIQRKPIIKSCREVSFEFIKNGYEVIQQYSRQAYELSGSKLYPKSYCFDDLGIEQNLKYFGNECNVMAEVLLSRYDLFISQNMTTHITTNLSASEIEDFYGNRLRSRMREMVNLISFDKSTGDKRK